MARDRKVLGASKQVRVDLYKQGPNAQRHQAEYLRLMALRVSAGPSNPQQGYVGTGHAKVHVINWDDGNRFGAGWFSDRAGPRAQVPD